MAEPGREAAVAGGRRDPRPKPTPTAADLADASAFAAGFYKALMVDPPVHYYHNSGARAAHGAGRVTVHSGGGVPFALDHGQRANRLSILPSGHSCGTLLVSEPDACCYSLKWLQSVDTKVTAERCDGAHGRCTCDCHSATMGPGARDRLSLVAPGEHDDGAHQDAGDDCAEAEGHVKYRRGRGAKAADNAAAGGCGAAAPHKAADHQQHEHSVSAAGDGPHAQHNVDEAGGRNKGGGKRERDRAGRHGQPHEENNNNNSSGKSAAFGGKPAAGHQHHGKKNAAGHQQADFGRKSSSGGANDQGSHWHSGGGDAFAEQQDDYERQEDGGDEQDPDDGQGDDDEGYGPADGGGNAFGQQAASFGNAFGNTAGGGGGFGGNAAGGFGDSGGGGFGNAAAAAKW